MQKNLETLGEITYTKDEVVCQQILKKQENHKRHRWKR